MTEKEVERIRTGIARNRPYGDEEWQSQQGRRLGLLHTLRREGRPRAPDRQSRSENELRPRFDYW